MNYYGLSENVVDAYEYGLAHGLQKDAVQNGWDARISSTKFHTKNNWSFRFVLTETSRFGNVLQMIDKGTSGLTGNLTARDINNDNLNKLDDNEKWAKFEAWGIRGEDGRSLGSRGQGKTLFIHSSSESFICYDSLREDDTYRFGISKIRKTDSPINSWDEAEARQKIKAEFDINPLKEQGTRIIILNLKKEIKEEIESGAFLRAIADTWWPNILKLGAQIFVEASGQKYRARVPEIYNQLCEQVAIKDTDTDKFSKEENIKVDIPRDKIKRIIKKIYLGYKADLELPELEQGVGCFRGGMKVDNSISFSPEFKDKAYGYVEFDQDLDREIGQVENPSHYGFKRAKPWTHIKKTIEDRVQHFERNKLGTGIDEREKHRKEQTADEVAALQFINELTKPWDIRGGASRVGTKSSPPTGESGTRPHKEIRLALRGFQFPHTNGRLDYGEAITGFNIEMINETSIEFKAKVNARIMQHRFIDSLLEDSETLKPNSKILTPPLQSKY